LAGRPKRSLERRNHVADHVFGRIMQQHGAAACLIEPRHLGSRQRFDQQRMLRNRKDGGALGLPVPARHARKPVRDVLDLDIERGGIEQVEPAS
jgi:uncharacterized protein (DUF2267 family)